MARRSLKKSKQKSELPALNKVVSAFDLRPEQLEPLGNAGGFSGANLWRGVRQGQPVCLKAWPRHSITSEQLTFIHQRMIEARQAGLEFVPQVFRLARQQSFIQHQGQFWDLTEWMPGLADYAQSPSLTRLTNACRALAQIHLVWQQSVGTRQGICPAVAYRLEKVNHWHSKTSTDHPKAQQLKAKIISRIEHVPKLLHHWLSHPVTLHPCLCDVWHDHLLFEYEQLTGLIDYGNLKWDHVAVDLSRMLGSLVEDDVQGWEHGLNAYRQLRPLSLQEEMLIRVLDQTGVIIGAMTWIDWLSQAGRQFDEQAMERRLDYFHRRLDRLSFSRLH